MNFSFRIIRLDGFNKRCQLYSVVKEGAVLNEAAQRTHELSEDDFGNLDGNLNFTKVRIERYGIR